MKSTISRILKSAAQSEIKKQQQQQRYYDPVVDLLTGGPIDKTPALIALTLLVMGFIPPTQILCVAFLSGYTFILGLIGASSKDTMNNGISNNIGTTGTPRNILKPVLPSLPPQGHVPFLLSNPLGHTLTNSITYRTWLRCGVWLGIIFPLTAMGFYRFRWNDATIARMVAKSTFLLCCQVTSEAVSRRLLAPLPIRILLPLAYNSFRLVPIYEWAMSPARLGYMGRMLAIANLIYWGANLFGFLIPIASMRYLRSYFFCVEAGEVTVREGDESNVGFIA